MTTTLDPSFLLSKSENELADLQHGRPIDDPLYILVQQEWQRRAMIEQHKLDLVIIAKQVRWMMFSVLTAIASLITGVFIGMYQQNKEIICTIEPQVIQAQKQTSGQLAPLHKEIIAPLVQKEAASKIE